MMESPPSNQRYETFQSRLVQFQTQLAQSSLAGTALISTLSQLQQFFQSQILAVEAVTHREQSLQVEMNKQLRLLAIDVTFLQAAKQGATRQQRQQQIQERLTLLIQYCKALLETHPS